jgi:hypothetical protein
MKISIFDLYYKTAEEDQNTVDRFVSCLDSCLECPPAMEANGVQIPAGTCLSRDALFEDVGNSLSIAL